MATSGFQVNGADLTANWPDKSYLLDRYPELADGLKQAGLWFWGSNQYGICGDNTTVRKSSPVQTISGGANWKYIGGVKGEHSASIKTDNTLWMTGFNYKGELGINSSGAGTYKSSPVQTVSAGSIWKQVEGGYNFTGALKADGTLWTWGNNTVGQLGNGTTGAGTEVSSPVQTISGGTNWKSIAVGKAFIAALKTDGTIWSWGDGTSGQLGNNSSSSRNSPVQEISGSTNWRLVNAGGYNTAAIKTDGTLWCWGAGAYGGNGDNTSTLRNSPVQTVAGGNNWKQIGSSFFHFSAIKTDGTLWMWGRNQYGQLGINDTVDRSSPVQTVAGGTNWKLTANGGYHHSAAIKTNGTLWTWGYNNYGQLGDNTIVNKSSPVQTVAGGTNWKSVALMFYNTSAIRDDSSDPLL